MKTRNLLLIFAASLTFAACDKKEEAPAEAEAPAAEEAEKPAEKAEKPAEEAKAEEGAAAAEATVAKVGEMAPDFELTDEAGNKHKLSDQKGKIVVLEWTSPECPVVQRVYDTGIITASHMTVSAIGKQEGKPEVVWMAVDSSNFAKPEASKAWADKHKFEYPTLQDPTGAVGKMYAAKTTPHMYVIDTEGKLRYAGAIDDDPHGKKDQKDVENFVNAAVASIANGEEVAKPETKPYGCSVKYGS